jgi:hypothetical protein
LFELQGLRMTVSGNSTFSKIHNFLVLFLIIFNDVVWAAKVKNWTYIKVHNFHVFSSYLTTLFKQRRLSAAQHPGIEATPVFNDAVLTANPI